LLNCPCHYKYLLYIYINILSHTAHAAHSAIYDRVKGKYRRGGGSGGCK